MTFCVPPRAKSWQFHSPVSPDSLNARSLRSLGFPKSLPLKILDPPMSKWHRSDRTPSAYNKVVAWPIVETALLGSVQSARTKLYCRSWTPLRELVFADSSVNNPIGIHTFRTWTQFSSVKFICCEQGLWHRTKQLNRKLIQGILHSYNRLLPWTHIVYDNNIKQHCTPSQYVEYFWLLAIYSGCHVNTANTTCHIIFYAKILYFIYDFMMSFNIYILICSYIYYIFFKIIFYHLYLLFMIFNVKILRHPQNWNRPT